MHIVRIDGSRVELSLDPEEGLAIADACMRTAEWLDDTAIDTPAGRRLECAFYRALGSAFEGYALLGHAGGMVKPDEAPALTPAAARQEWDVHSCDRRAE